MDAITRAAAIGREHRAAYIAEFGEPPVEGEVGDWDSTGWGEAARALAWDDTEDDYDRAHAAYLAALFGTTPPEAAP